MMMMMVTTTNSLAQMSSDVGVGGDESDYEVEQKDLAHEEEIKHMGEVEQVASKVRPETLSS